MFCVRERVEEAGGEPSQTAVAEGGVVFERFELFEIDAELRDDRLRLVVQLEVRQVVAEGAAHEELHREVVEPLGILIAIPPLASRASHRASDGGRRPRTRAAARASTPLPTPARARIAETLRCPRADAQSGARRCCRMARRRGALRGFYGSGELGVGRGKSACIAAPYCEPQPLLCLDGWRHRLRAVDVTTLGCAGGCNGTCTCACAWTDGCCCVRVTALLPR